MRFAFLLIASNAGMNASTDRRSNNYVAAHENPVPSEQSSGSAITSMSFVFVMIHCVSELKSLSVATFSTCIATSAIE